MSRRWGCGRGSGGVWNGAWRRRKRCSSAGNVQESFVGSILWAGGCNNLLIIGFRESVEMELVEDLQSASQQIDISPHSRNL